MARGRKKSLGKWGVVVVVVEAEQSRAELLDTA